MGDVLKEQKEAIRLANNYTIADKIPHPRMVGVGEDASIGGIWNSIKGIQYYADVTTFGTPSSGMTKGFYMVPYGINFFVPTGQQCSNGANAYTYIEGIPKGDALGKRITNAMKSIGFPALQGLAPGIVEDSREALNVKDAVGTLFQSAYPECTQVTKLVGNLDGKIGDASGQWIVGDTEKKGLHHYQTRWIETGKIPKEVFDCTPKIYKADGTKRASSDVPVLADECLYPTEEKFTNIGTDTPLVATLSTLCILAISYAAVRMFSK
jgi:hypothetical protein